MNDPDVVKELDHWIEETLVGEVFRALLHRARDEIVRLRAHYPVVANHYIEQARTETLEEAARACEGVRGLHTRVDSLDSAFQAGINSAIATIRALKEKDDDERARRDRGAE